MSEERRMGHGSSRPHPPHALVFQTFLRLPVEPLTATPRARAVGRAVGRAAEAEAHRRRRPHSSTIRASHVRDRAILFLRHHRVRLRASRPRTRPKARVVVPESGSIGLDRIRARGKIRARMDAYGRMMEFVRTRVRVDRERRLRRREWMREFYMRAMLVSRVVCRARVARG